ncbi:hypothetical protein sortsol_52 [Pseudomonas phage sortsol]|uniref:Uncharacterized protein n=1 Tax=Pseudomonas phage sortsol TaxID=2719610 RepID=A0A6G9LN90_9CAUD|nr:hypothetical protein sortsol_52 [Pseudomonas phage sortsol]
MDWKDIGSKIGAAAPALGSLLGGPAGAAVGGRYRRDGAGVEGRPSLGR